MIKSITDIFHASSGQLEQLISVDDRGGDTWQTADLEAMFIHQLAVPVQTELKLATQAYGLSFAELLHEQAPPVPLLQQAADFAAAQYSGLEGVLPKELTLVLYYACLAAAQAHAKARIASLSEEDLLKGWHWARELSWVNAPTRELFDEALRGLETT
jgi:hypothetical protein